MTEGPVKLTQVEYEYLWHKKNKTDEEKKLLAEFDRNVGVPPTPT